MFSSDYFLFAVAIWSISLPLWLRTDDEGSYSWVTLSFSVLPALLSFSLATLAILLALSNDLVLKLMRNQGAADSLLMKTSAAIIHFVVVEFVGLILAILLLAYQHWALSALAFFTFIYAVLCGVAAAMAIFGVAQIVNHAGILDDDIE